MKISSRLKSNLNPPPFFSIRVKSTGSMFGLVETSLREYVIRRLLDPFQSRKYRASIQIRVFKQRVLEPRLRSSPLQSGSQKFRLTVVFPVVVAAAAAVERGRSLTFEAKELDAKRCEEQRCWLARPRSTVRKGNKEKKRGRNGIETRYKYK